MPLDVFLRLLAIFAVVALGYVAGRARWVSGTLYEGDVSRILSNAAFTLFMPALLFRTTARIDFATMPWATLAVFFGPLFAMMMLVYAGYRRRPAPGDLPAAPAVRTITAGFGNAVQLGIPVSAALFGEAGLAIHLAIVSLHALSILSFVTSLAEIDLARARSREGGAPASLGRMLAKTVRNTVIHPVVLPVLGGLGWNVLGLPLPESVDAVLVLLGQAAVPLSLIVLGLSFEHHGLAGLRTMARPAATLAALKLLLLPALVLVVGRWGFGVAGMPLAVIVLCAALPTGSNALIFAQRYGTLTAEVTLTTVLATLLFAVTAPLWLLLLGAL